MHAFWAVVGGVFISLVAAELYVWLPLFANKLLRYNAKKLPEELSDRLLEEWQSALTDFPGYLTQFLFALDLLRGRQRIIHEFYFPQDSFRPSAEISTRLLAMMCSGLFLLCETPVMLLTALVLRMESSSPILRRDERIG
jgi:hypothetical protein